MHVRQKIRTDIVSILSSLEGIKKIYCNRTTPVDQQNLPAISVYFGEETITPVNMSNAALLTRSLELSIVLYTNASSFTDDKLDDLIAGVEALLPNADNINSVSNIRLNKITPFTDATGSTIINGAVIGYELTYRMKQGNPYH